LTYHLKKGDKATYRTVSTTDVSQEMMGQVQDISTTTRSVVHYEVKDIKKNGNFVIEATIDSISIQGNNPGLAQVQGMLNEVRDIPVTFELTPKGKVSSFKGLDVFPTLQGIGNWKKTFTSLFIQLPAKPVKIGDSWDQQEVTETGSAGLKINVSAKKHFTLKGTTTYKNKSCFNIPFTGEMTLSGKGAQAGMNLEFSGTGTFNGKVFFDPTVSSFWFLTSEYSTDGTVTIPSRNIEIPNSTTTSVKMERIK